MGAQQHCLSSSFSDVDGWMDGWMVWMDGWMVAL